jgi:uncharacterized protein with PQ loop repeat
MLAIYEPLVVIAAFASAVLMIIQVIRVIRAKNHAKCHIGDRDAFCVVVTRVICDFFVGWRKNAFG